MVDIPPYLVHSASDHACEKIIVVTRRSFLNFGALEARLQ